MIQRDQAGIAVAVLISFAVHAGAAYMLNHVRPLAEQPRNSASTRQVSLRLTLAITPDAMPEPPPAPVLLPEPVTQAVQKPRPLTVDNQPLLPAPVNAPEPETYQVSGPQHAYKKTAVAASVSPTPAEQPAPLQAAVVKTDNNYLAHLLEHIDEHKFYPRSARRRGLEGRVEVSFHLLEDGTIRNLHVTGGSRVLRTAAEQAIQRALPLPAPNGSIRLQQQVNFDMEYRLGKT
jgi:protein TonB